jgi:hypothetical protein
MATRSSRQVWRFVVVAVVVLGVINLGVLLVVSSDTSNQNEATVPSDVETVTPADGALADRRTPVSADLRDELTGVLVIDSLRIPEDQLDPISQGIITFRPGPDQEISSFDAGVHEVQVLYWPADEPEPATPQSFSWTFRATA